MTILGAVLRGRTRREPGRPPRSVPSPVRVPRVRTAALTAASLVLVLGGAGPAEAATTLPVGVTEEALLSDPTRYSTFKDYSVHERIVRLVNGTPAGESIHFPIWNLTYKPFADAIVAAQARGVVVWAVANGQNYGGTEFARVKAALGARFKVCHTYHPDGNIQSCISARPKSYAHSKFYLFSRTGTLSNVVVAGTVNMTNHGNEYNDALLVAGDATMYAGYVRYFNDMFAMRKNDNYTISANGTVRSPAALTTSWFSPRADSNGGTTAQTSTDTVALSMQPLAGGAACSTKVMMRYWDSSRSPVTNQLARLEKAGCDVRVLTDDADSATLSALQTAGIPVRKVRRLRSNGVTTKLHNKMYLLEGTYAGVAGARQVYTGSHNLFRSSLRSADEALVQATHTPVVDAYEAYFDRVWAASG